MSPKLIVIVGATGNQGGSVAHAFAQRSSEWRIRGITRNKTSKASQELASRGIEMVEANLHDPSTLVSAFKGANLIFSVTDFWTPFFHPANQATAKAQGKPMGRYAYELEYEQGKNIADAAASPEVLAGLDEPVGFIASTLSSARNCSKGRFTELWHFDAKADIFPGYVQERHPALARKMSYLQTGYFMSSWKLAGQMYLGKKPDGSFIQRFSTPLDTVVPQLEANKDTGHFAYALTHLPAGTTVMAAGTWCTWPEWVKTWARVVGVPEDKVAYKHVGNDVFDRALPDGFGKEIGEMFEYSGDPGYDGGDANVLRVDDLRKRGIEVPTTTLEEYFEGEDFGSVFDKAPDVLEE